ncbi:tyrosine-protein kinase Fer-like isoform X2 [Clavelina lepadiformis]|uniref:tyrosine-protein kinase Fer-like isoform X2 n=1 Tax=Clavelina lepadiformis TaxID=159417 RepID=UPI004043092D
MAFGANLLGKPSHDAIVKLQEHEIKFLEVVKRTIAARAKCEKEYANALAQITQLSTKIEHPEYDSPLYKAWDGIVRETSLTGQCVKENAELLQALSQEKVGCLIKDKTAMKKSYTENRERIDNEFVKIIHTGLDKKHSIYMKTETEVSIAHKNYDTAVEKGKLTALEKAQEKYKKATMRFHNHHNDYVLQVTEAQMHQTHYRNTILPELLNGMQYMEEQYVETIKSILLEYLELVSPCREDYISSHKMAEEGTKEVNANSEYNDFVETQRTALETEALIKFEPLRNEGALLPQNQIFLNSLSLQRIDHLAHTYLDDLEVIQVQIQDYSQRLNDLEFDIQKISQNFMQMLLMAKNQEFIGTKLNLVERQQTQVRQQQLHYLLNQTLQELGDGPASVGLDLPELDGMSISSADYKSPEHKGGGVIPKFSFNKIKPFKVPFKKSSVKSKDQTDEPLIFDPSKADRDQRWFHGMIPRQEAMQLIVSNGDFLLRESTNSPGEFVLSGKSENQIRHFKIQKNEQDHYRFESDFYNTVFDLIYEHYSKQIPVTKKTNCLLKNPICKDKWQLTHNDISIDENNRLGAGNFGTVYRGLLIGTNQWVAVKTCKENVDRSTRDKFLMEARILKEFDHPNIVKLIGVCTDRQPIYIVMELVEGGDLGVYLKKLVSQLYTHHLVGFCRDACAGLAYLEGKKCIHRDVAARNCLVSQTCSIKITDFGMSREEDDGIYTASGYMKSIPVRWTAPEALNFGQFTSASDVWSFGVLSWEIFAYGKQPYPNMTNLQTRESIEKGYRMPMQENCPREYYEQVMVRSWENDPGRRPRFADLLITIDNIYRNAGGN